MLVAIIIDLPFSRFMWKMWVTTSLCVDFSSSWSTIFEILNGNYEPLNDHYEPLHCYIQQIFFLSDLQKQPSRGVLVKRCSKNMQQIYKTTSMPKCDFNKVAKQLYWNRTLAWVFSCKFASYFQEHLWVAASENSWRGKFLVNLRPHLSRCSQKFIKLFKFLFTSVS